MTSYELLRILAEERQRQLHRDAAAEWLAAEAKRHLRQLREAADARVGDTLRELRNNGSPSLLRPNPRGALPDDDLGDAA